MIDTTPSVTPRGTGGAGSRGSLPLGVVIGGKPTGSKPVTGEDDAAGGSPYRARTDESLRAEREATDRAWATRQDAAEREVDQVIGRAGDSVDATPGAARARADASADWELTAPVGRPTAAAERTAEDDVLRRTRAAADDARRLERLERARTSAELLSVERATTDLHLLAERSRAEAALSHRDGVLGVVSHDLRDLLDAIVTTARTLATGAPGHQEADDTRIQTDRIERFAVRGKRWVGDLVDVAAINAGELAVTRMRGDAQLLMSEAVDASQEKAAANGLVLEVAGDGQPLDAEFDRDRLLQVFANVIGNAIKFTDPGGRVTVSGTREVDTLHFSVRDTGVGLPEDRLAAIFERFWQAGTADQRGLGLGLYISKAIVAAHGGRMWAISTEGRGTTVVFSVAVAAPSPGTTGVA